MRPTERDEVVRVATEIGMPSSLFDEWDGGELALYQIGQRIALDPSWVDLMVRVVDDPTFDRAELVAVFVGRMIVNEALE